MKSDLRETVDLPEGVSATSDNGIITVKGPKGEVVKAMKHPKVKIEVDGHVIFSAEKATKREKTQIFTYRAHLRNMIAGVQEPYVYKVKICSGHFPMNVAINNGELQVKNFLGEKVPRVVKLKQGGDVKIDGEIITITSCDKEIAGQIAADFEQLTRVTNRDRRIFQDGLYIIEKAGNPI